MAAKKWSKVAVAVQSALATAVVINSISLASPPVVAYTGTDPVNGDYVLMKVQGMFQVNDRVFRVANVNGAGNTFELEAQSSVGFDAFVSGTFQVITFGTTMATAVGLTASGGDFGFLDTSTIHDNIKTQIPGQAEPASYSFDNLWDPADTALAAFKSASDNQAERCVRFTFAGGEKVVFNGFIGCTMLPTGNAHELVKTSVTVTMLGRPTIYTT
jgi:hypothetical protein